MNEVHHLSLYIDCPVQTVYQFASNPVNLPLWAAGLAQSNVIQEGNLWLVEAPFGRVRIEFAPTNPFGVMDHTVELENGERVYNPMRVVPHGDGCEFTFTLFRRDGMSDEAFFRDKMAVINDLNALKERMENH
ncbi:SRPBCC family protein [Vibrio fluvialis]|uniref:SRPBCC family protein n=1 Tax=Vibrio fluvialis TaxID=676 RepID=UPI001558CA3E|nr:SRPBCC family protein [Vibrio fluvialis]MBY8314355.1 SRPBCC family protein [Vibrio fluvialis]MCE7614430.1 SRPBCC family protein [Vibrio fluvialis]